MTHLEFTQRRTFSKEELMACANGTLVEDGPREMGRLPSPPLLMVDRVVDVQHNGNRGRIVAEQDVPIDAWYFWCHFRHDPVQPGCLGIEAIWQLMGLYLAIRGVDGSGRALCCKEIEFTGQIRPHNRHVRYEIDITRFAQLRNQNSAIAIGDGTLIVDGDPIYTVRQARVATFGGIEYPDYPHRSRNGVGGLVARQPAPAKEVTVPC